MKVVIVEDEITASENLAYAISTLEPEFEIIASLASVKEAVAFFSARHEAELVFMDIHLADGISFQIFEQVNIDTPVIFTTAYDQYALQAFKVNSVDYLLKHIDEDELRSAIDKFKNLNTEITTTSIDYSQLLNLVQQQGKTYKTTFLVQKRDEFLPISTADIAYFTIDTGVVKATTDQNKSYVVNYKLEDLEQQLNPEEFLRVNRQFIVRKTAVVNLKQYFHGKLIMNVNPTPDGRIEVSKAKASEVKQWLDH